MKLIQKGAVGIFNISSNERISKYNFAKKLAKEFRLNDKLIMKDKNFFISRQAKRPLNMALSNKKVKKFLEINIPSIRDQIKREIVASKKDIFKNFFINVQQYGSHYIDQQDINEVVKVLKSDSLTQGPKIFEFEEAIAKYVGSKYAVAVSSCTAGLHICGIVAGIKKNSNSITSPISFVSTANAITYNSGNILFCDIDPKDLNIDIIKLKKLIKKNKNIKAIFPVHFAGYPCNMKEIFELAKKKILPC
jgi:cystathionine beta-lyase/cystathionine gamma-synthase